MERKKTNSFHLYFVVGDNRTLGSRVVSWYHVRHYIFFVESAQNKELCTVQIDAKELEQLKEAIEDLYYFEFVLGKSTVSLSVGTQAHIVI